MKRSEGERIRAKHILDRLNACIKSVELALRDEESPIGYDSGNAIMQTAFELGTVLAKLDAYQRAEQDQRSMISVPKPGDHLALDPLNRVTCTCLACEMDARDPHHCAKCGKKLSEKAYKELQAYKASLCSYCGHPKNSTTCQQSHP